jgi:capsid portal protein
MGEVIHLYNPNSRSTYYGIPSYLSALGSILGDSKARDYNIDRFDSKLIAPWAIVFAGELSEKVKQGIINKFRANNQNRTSAQEPLIIEAMGATDTDAVRFHRLSDEVKEASFMAFRRLNRDEILAARRVPPSKVTAFDASRFQTLPEQAEAFREEVVIPRQQKLEFALELVIAEVGITDWAIQLPVADTTEQSHLFDIAVRAVGAQSFRRNEIRSICGFPPLTKEEGGDDVVGAPPAGGENPLAALLGGQPADKSAGYHQLMQIEENIAKCLTRNDSEF